MEAVDFDAFFQEFVVHWRLQVVQSGCKQVAVRQAQVLHGLVVRWRVEVCCSLGGQFNGAVLFGDQPSVYHVLQDQLRREALTGHLGGALNQVTKCDGLGLVSGFGSLRSGWPCFVGYSWGQCGDHPVGHDLAAQGYFMAGFVIGCGRIIWVVLLPFLDITAVQARDKCQGRIGQAALLLDEVLFCLFEKDGFEQSAELLVTVPIFDSPIHDRLAQPSQELGRASFAV